MHVIMTHNHMPELYTPHVPPNSHRNIEEFSFPIHCTSLIEKYSGFHFSKGTLQEKDCVLIISVQRIPKYFKANTNL